ncbi:MAG: hypothetical protein ACK5UA_11780 [Cereibacter sp.]|jgi:hypothetical protein
MMSNRRAAFTQSDLTKVIKAFRDAGVAQPKMILEPGRITIIPVDSDEGPNANPWDTP